MSDKISVVIYEYAEIGDRAFKQSHLFRKIALEFFDTEPSFYEMSWEIFSNKVFKLCTNRKTWEGFLKRAYTVGYVELH